LARQRVGLQYGRKTGD